jgi:8-oxo-dGTP pyrophosphatase MutT (NUDIX family)
VLVKDYGCDIPGKPYSRYAVILGHTRGSAYHYNFQAGKCDQGDRSSTITASRELEEETGCAVKIKPHILSQQPYIYSHQKQLFFVRDDRLSVRQITQSCQSACNNKRLPHCYREVDHAVAVPLSDFLKLAARIRHQKIHPKQYLVKSRTGNHMVKIDGYYMRMIANRLPEVRVILNNLFPGGRF